MDQVIVQYSIKPNNSNGVVNSLKIEEVFIAFDVDNGEFSIIKSTNNIKNGINLANPEKNNTNKSLSNVNSSL